jgi:integrase
MASIRKRTLPSRKVVWQVDYRDNRRKRRHKQFRTKGEADDWLVKARGEVADGTHVAARESMLVRDAGDAWIKDCERNGLERSTLDVYRQRLKDHINPFIGDKKLSELSPTDAQTFYEELLEQLRSRDMVRRVRINVGAILRYAQKKGWVGKNVISLTPYKFSKRNKKRPPMPALEEIQAMLSRTAEAWADWLAMMYVLVFCGLRSSEVRALTWDNIDLKINVLKVTQRADKWGRIGTPKSDAGTRDIKFVPAVGQELRRWKLRCPRSALNLVFPSRTGTVQNHANIMNRFFRPMQLEASVKNVGTGIKRRDAVKVVAKYGMHALRHFCASLWIEADYSPKRVQVMMGHASIMLTFDTYGYLFDQRENVDEALKKTQNRVLGR